jgi:hypothetical protein
MRGTRAGCSASAASGAARRLPAKVPMNVRRFMTDLPALLTMGFLRLLPFDPRTSAEASGGAVSSRVASIAALMRHGRLRGDQTAGPPSESAAPRSATASSRARRHHRCRHSESGKPHARGDPGQRPPGLQNGQAGSWQRLRGARGSTSGRPPAGDFRGPLRPEPLERGRAWRGYRSRGEMRGLGSRFTALGRVGAASPHRSHSSSNPICRPTAPQILAAPVLLQEGVHRGEELGHLDHFPFGPRCRGDERDRLSGIIWLSKAKACPNNSVPAQDARGLRSLRGM